MAQEHRNLGPALRNRLLAVPVGAKISLRALTGEFGRFVAPEMAYRRWQQTAAESAGMMLAITLTQEQQVALGRMRVISDTLQRMGAKFDGARTLNPDRQYYLPPDARSPLRASGGPTFLELPAPQVAIDWLKNRYEQLDQGKARSWGLDDRRAVTTLVNLAKAALAAGIADDLLDGGAPMVTVPAPAGPAPGAVNPKEPTAFEKWLQAQ